MSPNGVPDSVVKADPYHILSPSDRPTSAGRVRRRARFWTTRMGRADILPRPDSTLQAAVFDLMDENQNVGPAAFGKKLSRVLLAFFPFPRIEDVALAHEMLQALREVELLLENKISPPKNVFMEEGADFKTFPQNSAGFLLDGEAFWIYHLETVHRGDAIVQALLQLERLMPKEHPRYPWLMALKEEAGRMRALNKTLGWRKLLNFPFHEKFIKRCKLVIRRLITDIPGEPGRDCMFDSGRFRFYFYRRMQQQEKVLVIGRLERADEGVFALWRKQAEKFLQDKDGHSIARDGILSLEEGEILS